MAKQKPAARARGRNPNPRFMTAAQLGDLVNLYHLARGQTRFGTAGKVGTKYDAMILSTKWFNEKYPSISATAAYKELDTQLGRNPNPPSSAPAGANPPRELIYPEVLAIVARKNPDASDHKCSAACRKANHIYEHKFSGRRGRRPRLVGMPGGTMSVE